MRRYCAGTGCRRWKLRQGIESQEKPAYRLRCRERAPAAPGKRTPAPPCCAERICDSRNVYQPRADGVNHKFGSLVNTQRISNIGAMNPNRFGAELENRRNLFVRLAADDQLQHFEFARSQRATAFPSENRLWFHLGIENSFPTRNSPHGRSQLQVHGILQNVSLGASFDGLAHPGALGVHTEHEDRGLRQVFKNLPSSLKAVRLG